MNKLKCMSSIDKFYGAIIREPRMGIPPLITKTDKILCIDNQKCNHTAEFFLYILCDICH